MIHRFKNKINETEIPSLFTYPYCYSPHILTQKAASEVIDYIQTTASIQKALTEGKMFGVLVVKDNNNSLGYIAAFSGQLGGNDTHNFFVPPIFDYLAPNGYFKKEEKAISDINKQIDSLLNSQEFISARESLSEFTKVALQLISDAKKKYAINKSKRALLRQNQLSSQDEATLIKQSQFEKAEIKRLEKRLNDSIVAQQSKIDDMLSVVESLKSERKRRSADLQYWLFEQFVVYNSKNVSMTLNQIFKHALDKYPPAGAGECAAPKMLQFAYLNNLKPICMGEFWWGPSPENEVRHQGFFYPSCHNKCEPILNFMLQGLNVEPNPLLFDKKLSLNVIYEDDSIIVVNKPCGLLSIPGKDCSDSVQSRLQSLCNTDGFPVVAHRLDMSTSGILVAAKNLKTLSDLQHQFESRTVKKRYIAILDGIPKEKEGFISLPLCLNVNNSPEQIVNQTYGKEAITRYKVVESIENRTRIEFYPLTGRTHQLRVHASHKNGLNCPIVGDSLYGKMAERLMLHSEMIEFKHPATGKIVHFEVVADF